MRNLGQKKIIICLLAVSKSHLPKALITWTERTGNESYIAVAEYEVYRSQWDYYYIDKEGNLQIS